MALPFDHAAELSAFDNIQLDILRNFCRDLPEEPGRLATACLPDVVMGWILGRADEVAECLSTLASWFERAHLADERYEQASRYDAWGLCLWMINGVNSPEPYRHAVTHWEQHFAVGGTKERSPAVFDHAAQRFLGPITGLPMTPKQILGGGLADYLASCVQCGEFARGAALYEKVGGKTHMADTRIQTDLHLGYWLCKHGASGGIDAGACDAIGTRVLGAKMPSQWLGVGQYLRAATWLKIVAEFADWRLPPRLVLSRAATFACEARK